MFNILMDNTDDHERNHFAQHGVCPADMAQLSPSIDRDALKSQRKAF